MLTLLSFVIFRYRLKLVALWRYLWSQRQDPVSLTDEAVKCYEAAEGKSLKEALSWIARGDAVMKRRDIAK